MRKEAGSVQQLLATGICLLAMTSLMMAYFGCSRLMHRKDQVNQVARKYILRMETVGFLQEPDRNALLGELAECGLEKPDLSGTTLRAVSYGEEIVLHISGYLEGKYRIEETRVSTAKN